ncbi:Membrane-Associated Guanylate Kinase, Ww And Pdz Domain-Containing Protein 1 [Manis pentadactyla]|nr:Membrane-Associated Guanylate Kinase, Ww And Pdz Domain-Containing Protein 1 [Manis pentadactyla]
MTTSHKQITEAKGIPPDLRASSAYIERRPGQAADSKYCLGGPRKHHRVARESPLVSLLSRKGQTPRGTGTGRSRGATALEQGRLSGKQAGFPPPPTADYTGQQVLPACLHSLTNLCTLAQFSTPAFFFLQK